MRETGKGGFHSKVKKKLEKEFPDCEIHKLDPVEKQGSPDLLLLCPITWATLEVKGNEKSKRQPNQEYYVNKHKSMSFSSFIFPENEEEVFDGLHEHIRSMKKENRK